MEKSHLSRTIGGKKRKQESHDFVGVHSGHTINWAVDKKDGQLKPWVDGLTEPIVWAPQPGSQQAFIACPIQEALLEGNRGGGKTDVLLMDYLKLVGQGHGVNYRGILFRRTFPELADVINKASKLYARCFPRAKYNQGTHTWKFPEGEQLLFRFIQTKRDYERYHGFNLQWIGWEELTTWPSDDVYRLMFSTLRTADPKIPLRVRATTNPSGPGHNWVKRRFRLPNKKTIGPVIKTEGEPKRVAIKSRLNENKVLIHADPMYAERIKAAASNPHQLAAWMEGDWNITSGGMFDDLWEPSVHVVPNIGISDIPEGWRLDRSYDHGQSRPFSVGWWAESNGEPIDIKGRKFGEIPGDVVRIYEWYGSSGESNEGIKIPSSEIARGILARQHLWQLNVHPGPADSSIWDDFEPGKSVAGIMLREGVQWRKADKGPGSRKQGWEMLREYLKGAIIRPREQKGLFICERCEDFIRTFPTLPRNNRDLDDVDTDAEDHAADEARYRLRKRWSGVKVKNF